LEKKFVEEKTNLKEKTKELKDLYEQELSKIQFELKEETRN
jgi:hypothetical protein